MKAERPSEKRGDEALRHAGTLNLDRANALEQVLRHYGLSFRVVANEGAPYPDGGTRVPKGHVFVTYETGKVPERIIWRMVAATSPTPNVDGRR